MRTCARLTLVVVFICVFGAKAEPAGAAQVRTRLPGYLRHGLNQITPASLHADLAFLASDALEGRATPSQGLDVAAEFIRSRFERLKLSPAGENGYFQNADVTEYVRAIAQRRGRPAPQHPIRAKNVIAVLPGADPHLRNTYLVVSAHYDHLGKTPAADGASGEGTATDKIYNGANDDGSGTVGVLALAEAFTRLPVKPRRSIVFMTVCCEELGLLGSRYFVDHPTLPLNQIVGAVNLEQIGRSDGDLGHRTVSLTGFHFTDIPALFARSGADFNITAKRLEEGDTYFSRSDNYNFAKAGIPDTTLCSAFEFPDYHRVEDEISKIDVNQMADVVKLTGLALWRMANNSKPPRWNEQIEQVQKFKEAARQLYEGKAAPTNP